MTLERFLRARGFDVPVAAALFIEHRCALFDSPFMEPHNSRHANCHHQCPCVPPAACIHRSTLRHCSPSRRIGLSVQPIPPLPHHFLHPVDTARFFACLLPPSHHLLIRRISLRFCRKWRQSFNWRVLASEIPVQLPTNLRPGQTKSALQARCSSMPQQAKRTAQKHNA